MQPSRPNVYGLNCVRCGSALELPADPMVVHCNCAFCGLDNVLPQEIINARRPPPSQPEARVVVQEVVSPAMRHRQAVHAQMIFALERGVENLQKVAQGDRLAAAILSIRHLRTVGNGGVTVESFDDIEHKRAFGRAIDTLTSLRRPVEQDSHGLAVLMAMDNSEKWRTAMGVNPQARLAEMEADLARARGFTKKTKLFLILTILLIPLSFALAVAAVVAAGIAGLDLDDSVPTLFAYVFVAGLFGAPVVLLIHWSGKQGLPSRERKVTELRTQLDAYNAFLADPQGGALWEQALRDHPALRAGIPANA